MPPGPITTTGFDLEAALEPLRGRLDDAGVLLGCNRFRRNALLTGMARSMGDGKTHYLLSLFREPDIRTLVASLAPAPLDDVVTAAEAAAFIERCRKSLAFVRALRFWDR